jgi:hypothetical protein
MMHKLGDYMKTIETNGSRISDEYAAAFVDSRALVHFGAEPVLTLQIPQRAIAEALIEHWGCGELSSFRSETNGKYYNNIVIREPDIRRVLESTRPHLVSNAAHYVDAYLALCASGEA